MFLPAGYHIDASVSGEKDAPSSIGSVPYLFPAGIGSALMNGCWGTGYKPGDPCYAAKWTSDVCQVNILNYVFTTALYVCVHNCIISGTDWRKTICIFVICLGNIILMILLPKSVILSALL